ncbi:MAG TPA: glycosyltransferase family 2 protein [Acidimicrobiales bacterium]|nr:glycosyltransferase family 2 protein [Acidimicrobiales bacterium]
MTATVVVVSHRPGDWLEPCLASVCGQAEQVLVVDNGSEGGEASRLGEAAGARVLRMRANIGFAPAVNLAARSSSGELIALLNDDAVAGPGWLEAAANALRDPSVAAVGPKVVLAQRFLEIVLADEEWQAPGDGRRLGRQVRSVSAGGLELLEKAEGPGIHRLERDEGGDRWRWTAGPRPWYVPLPDGVGAADVAVDGEPVPAGRTVRLVNSAGGFLDDRGYGGDIGEGSPDDGRFDAPADRFAISGVAFVTRMETWRRLGPFAARFFAYYEDVDWCWRANLNGMRLRYDPVVSVEHRRSASSGGEHKPWVRVMAERNRTLSLVRNGPRARALRGLADRVKNGPDGGVRDGIARLLPWALATRAGLSRSWKVRPEDVWDRWAGVGTQWPASPAGERAYVS